MSNDTARCRSCGFEGPPGFRFCGQCGAALSSGEDADNRQVTVLLCDLVGSTDLSQQLGPEGLRDHIHEYQAIAGEVIGRFSGYVAQYLGDGLLIYFGYPNAHEDDPERAIHAGLAILDAMVERNAALDGHTRVPLHLRIGVHTGEVVAGTVGSGGAQERLVLGLTPNIAARLEHLAEPGSLLLSHATWSRVRGLFEFEALGLQELRGVNEPMEVFRALRANPRASRFDAAVNRGLSSFVGRRSALAILLERYEEAAAGTGRVVLISGEAGIGKSRLLHQLRESARAEKPEEPFWSAIQCSPMEQTSSFFPLIRSLIDAVDLRDDDTDEAKLGKLMGRFESLELGSPGTLPLLASLLGVAFGDRFASLDMTAQRRREETLTCAIAALLEIAGKRLPIIVFEDVHWIDPSTLEFLNHLVHTVPARRLLVIATFRPTFEPPWGAPGHLSHVTLGPLTKAQVEHMAAELGGLSAEKMRSVVERSDGVPLYVEELVLMMEAEAEHATPIPGTLRDLLTARLDLLGSAKTAAQVASVLGRGFGLELHEATSGIPASDLRGDLERLVEAEVLQEQGDASQPTFAFKHALFQDAAYRSMLTPAREEFHSHAVDALLRRAPGVSEPRPELLAHHYTKAGRFDEAAAAWLEAGSRAIEASANVEAIDLLTSGIEVVPKLSDPAARRVRELELRTALGRAHTATKGYGASEVEAAYTRAHELCVEIGDRPEFFWTLWGLWSFYLMRGDLKRAVALAERLERLAEHANDRSLVMHANYCLGVPYLYMGRAQDCIERLRAAIALDPAGRSELDANARYTALDIGVGLRSFCGLALWHQGYADQAVEMYAQAMNLARRLNDNYAVVSAMAETEWLYVFLREPQKAAEAAQEGIALAAEHGFLFWFAVGNFLLGWATANGAVLEEGSSETIPGLERMTQYLEMYKAFGGRLGSPYWLSLTAESFAQRGKLESARRYIDEALSDAIERDEFAHQPELYRVSAEIRIAELGRSSRERARVEAEIAADFERAISLGAKLGARAFELRASIGYARLLHRQGRPGEARETLRRVLEGFTEGWDTPDVREANAMLEVLR